MMECLAELMGQLLARLIVDWLALLLRERYTESEQGRGHWVGFVSYISFLLLFIGAGIWGIMAPSELYWLVLVAMPFCLSLVLVIVVLETSRRRRLCRTEACYLDIKGPA